MSSDLALLTFVMSVTLQCGRFMQFGLLRLLGWPHNDFCSFCWIFWHKSLGFIVSVAIVNCYNHSSELEENALLMPLVQTVYIVVLYDMLII